MQIIPQMMPQMMPHGGMHPMMFSNGGMPMMSTMPPMVPTAESDSESSHEPPAAAPVAAAPSSSAAGAAPPSNPSHDAPPPSIGFSDAMKQKISRSMTYVRQLPRWFIQEVVEFLNPNFDATLVADLSQHGLLSLLFLFCRIKPNVRITELRSLIQSIVAKTSFGWIVIC